MLSLLSAAVPVLPAPLPLNERSCLLLSWLCLSPLVSFCLLPLPAMVQAFQVHNYSVRNMITTLLIEQDWLYVFSQWFLVRPEDLKTCMQSKCFPFVWFAFCDILAFIPIMFLHLSGRSFFFFSVWGYFTYQIKKNKTYLFKYLWE